MVRHVLIYVYDKINVSLILLDVDLPPVAPDSKKYGISIVI